MKKYIANKVFLKLGLLMIAAIMIVGLGWQLEAIQSEVKNKDLTGNAAVKPLRIIAIGDINCESNAVKSAKTCQAAAVANAIKARKPDAVLILGDIQYEDGTYEEFTQNFDKVWGELKEISYPIPGNHEYNSPDANGYYRYWGAQAHDPKKGYYSFDLGAWRFIGLNSNCEFIGGCHEGSEQINWLNDDLSTPGPSCTLAFWHHPLFSSGQHGNNEAGRIFWQKLYEHNADVVLAGHEHLYERFLPQDSQGRRDDMRGITGFTVGTGGKSLHAFQKDFLGTHAFGQDESFGYLEMTLYPSSYTWHHRDISNKVLDQGSSTCR